MKPYLENLNAMLAIWNTTDPAKQKALADKAFEQGGVFENGGSGAVANPGGGLFQSQPR